MTEQLVYIDNGYGVKPLTAGLVLRDGVVVKAAPLLDRMLGWTVPQLRRYCKINGWKIALVKTTKLRRYRSVCDGQ